MDYKDDELNKLLKPLKNQAPNDLQMQKWQQAVRKELTRSKVITTTRLSWASQLAAAVVVGIIIGASIFKFLGTENDNSNLIAQITLNDATFEHSHANLD